MDFCVSNYISNNKLDGLSYKLVRNACLSKIVNSTC